MINISLWNYRCSGLLERVDEMRYANQIGPLEREAARHAIREQIGRGVHYGGAADNQQLPPYDDMLLDDDEREEFRLQRQQGQQRFQPRQQ